MIMVERQFFTGIDNSSNEGPHERHLGLLNSFLEGRFASVPNQPQGDHPTIESQGAIKEMSLPAGWSEIRTRSGGSLMRALQSTAPGDTDTTITLMEHGRSIADQSATAFKDVLNKGAGHKLSAEEIKSVTEALGNNTVGDNQYSNKYPPGDRYAPVFDIKCAETVDVNGKTALKINGSFVDQNGAPSNDYSGYFFSQPGDGKHIQDVNLTTAAGNRGTYDQAFADTLKSIVWK